MSPAELQEAKETLRLLKAERTRRHLGGRVASAGNGGETVSRIYSKDADLLANIRELEAEIRTAEGCAYGAIHIGR